ncbi:MAG: ABC transporter substrate-binding protein [Alphaproteobacteria bacterium]|nr:ABC transporter substrate-binding protein [Alphaproteobacteria bacterium]
MRRRTIVIAALLASAPGAAQTPLPRIGMLFPQAASGGRHPVEAELAALGYIEGRSAVFERRWADGRFERMPALAEELVRLRCDVIIASTTASALALKRATSSIPIVVLSSGDAVGSGLVESLARPGGNVTGNSFLGPELAVKQIELVRELVPGIGRAAFVANAAMPPEPIFFGQMQEAASRSAIAIEFIDTRRPEEFESSVSKVIASGAQAAIFAPGGYSDRADDRARLLVATAGLRIPSLFFRREFVDSGGLISYGASFAVMNRQAAAYVDRILRGANPAGLPVLQPTVFELVINLGAARRLGIGIPPLLLARADEVIE